MRVYVVVGVKNEWFEGEYESTTSVMEVFVREQDAKRYVAHGVEDHYLSIVPRSLHTAWRS